MTAIMVMGLQWGDEGKGRIVDLIAEGAHAVVRFNGGPNAGHTIPLRDGSKIAVHQLPSGILNPHANLCLGRGMVIDLPKLVKEIKDAGINPLRVMLDPKAHILAPCHIAEDVKAEEARGANAIGTTRTGNGPAYADKYARVGMTIGNLLDWDDTEASANRMGGLRTGRSSDELVAWALDMADILQTSGVGVEDVSEFIMAMHRNGKRILFECAHGFELDIDHGDYPYVTSSSCGIGGVYSGVGFSPKSISHVVGVIKPYSTRVGAGSFPPRFEPDVESHIRDLGGEYGVTTGRPRAIGFLDLLRLVRACRMNSVSRLVLTHLDIAQYLEHVPLVDLDGSIQSVDWWNLTTFIEERLGVPIQYISDGPQHGSMQRLFGEEGTDADLWKVC